MMSLEHSNRREGLLYADTAGQRGKTRINTFNQGINPEQSNSKMTNMMEILMEL